MTVAHAFSQALQAATALAVSHFICFGIIMYYDLSGKWAAYSINPKRSVTATDYLRGAKSFFADIACLFLPVMTFCFWYRAAEIVETKDSILTSLLKLTSGYILGKVWAFGVHYILHFPWLYHIHRRHHRNPREIVASQAWEDSFVEYLIMEIPSFAITVLLFPTHFYIHLMHYCWHGWDGACGHSGYAAPGIFGKLFDGEYHYYHHAHLTVNYAELEFLDKLCGTHHSQRKHSVKKTT